MSLQMNKPRGQTPPSETVVKTLALLDLFSINPAQTASEIAKNAQLPLSTAFRLLTTLANLNFIEIDPATRKYRLGLKLLELGHIVAQQLDLPSLALPILHDLMQKAGETSHLSIRDGNEGVFISKVETLHNIRLHTPLGRRVPLYAGASMKVLLAFQPQSDIDAYIAQFAMRPLTDKTITDPARLLESLETIRRNGYAVSFSEQSQGAAGVAAPVRDQSGQVVAGVTISGPEQRFTKEKVMFFAQLVLEATATLSGRLGWKG